MTSTVNWLESGFGYLAPPRVSNIDAQIKHGIRAMDRKKRANDTKQPSPETSAQRSEATVTLSQRVGESATNLLKESFKRPSPQTVTGVLNSLKTEIAKAGPSSSSTNTGESSLAVRSSSQCGQDILDHGESFRSNKAGGRFGRCHGQVAFDEFLTGLNGSEHESEFVQDGPVSNGDQRLGFPLGLAEDNLPLVQDKQTLRMQDQNQGFADQDFDGAAVVALLSDPASTLDTESSITLVSESRKGPKRETLQTGKGLIKPIAAIHPSNPLVLVPNFSATCNSTHASLTTQKGIHERGNFLESGCGDVQPWIDMLHLYHDEVWGDMLPLVQEAREELKATIEGKTRLYDSPAIRRLRMVLQHLGNHNHR